TTGTTSSCCRTGASTGSTRCRTTRTARGPGRRRRSRRRRSGRRGCRTRFDEHPGSRLRKGRRPLPPHIRQPVRQRFLTRTVPQREERRQRRSPSPAGGKTDRIARELRRGLLRSGAESLSLANSPQDTCTGVLKAGAPGTGEEAGSSVSLPPTLGARVTLDLSAVPSGKAFRVDFEARRPPVLSARLAEKPLIPKQGGGCYTRLPTRPNS